ncbi:MAG: haloacid dehalogenase-like hydrolase [Firmicutes bacterium]|nr:haloacid dehalogenase-like hydrolase [Bacillota bacterium]
MKFKKLLALTLAFSSIFSASAFASEGFIKDNRTLVPVRGVFEELGFNVAWDSENATATIEDASHTVVIQKDENYFTVDGNRVEPDVPQSIVNDKFYLPLRAVGESIGAELSWDSENKVATIEYQGKTATVNCETENTSRPLSLWTDGATSKEALISYMEDITDPSSKNFIPVEDRVAVFDFDGTLFMETDPNYFDYMLLVHRVLDDENYKDKASDFEKEVAQKIVTQNETGESFKDLPTEHGQAVASAFKGMSLEEFYNYVEDFKKDPLPSYNGLNRGDGWYLPMLEVVNYLEENDFTVYVISGTDRFIVRGLAQNSPLDVPVSRIIGSDETLVASSQGDTDGLDYMITPEDKLILGGDFVIKNLKMNKVTVIAKEIGQQPVLSFGNSSGDSSMAEYTVSNNPYKALAFMLCCDDLERENGNEKKANDMYELCQKYNWIPVSMKNDWNTIYGDKVSKK